MVCDVGEGTVHRLWEPLAAKQTPANGYAGKFSTPYCIAAGFVRGNVGLGDFTDEAVREPAVVALAKKVSYRIDPQNPYPRAFTGHIRATLNDGRVIEERQPHFRGGAKEPLTQADIEEKFVLNCRTAAGTRRGRSRRSRCCASSTTAGSISRRCGDRAAQLGGTPAGNPAVTQPRNSATPFADSSSA